MGQNSAQILDCCRGYTPRMITSFLQRYRWWLLTAGFLGALAVAGWFGWRWFARYEGNSEEVFARLRIGMTMREAVGILASFHEDDGCLSQGITTDGQEFSTMDIFGSSLLDGMPQPDRIASCVVTGRDYNDREIELTFGRGGIVTCKRLSPGYWEYRRYKTGSMLCVGLVLLCPVWLGFASVRRVPCFRGFRPGSVKQRPPTLNV